jgi:juxtaposed with another zinc finger protein 1
MAVFLLNICKFNKCGMEFGTLVDLIQHIEENHIGKSSGLMLFEGVQGHLLRRPFQFIIVPTNIIESIWKLDFNVFPLSLRLDYDPITKPDCLPLSCVQRYITDATRKENPQFLVSAGSVESLDRTSNASERVEVKRKIAIKHHSYSMSSSNRSNTPTGKTRDLFLINSHKFKCDEFAARDDELIGPGRLR